MDLTIIQDPRAGSDNHARSKSFGSDNHICVWNGCQTQTHVSGMVARPMHGFARTTRLSLPDPRA